jgi:16S rRNA (guanine(966)-N(2))-methyltransferase RsmD
LVLKVIAGTARGRMLKTLPYGNLSIRPILGRIKKSIFDIMQLKIYNSVFIDLFAGVGSVGIEALSRGAKKVVFAELNTISLSLIKHNVNMLGFGSRSEIIKCDIVKNFYILKGKYDIVFVGSPYKKDNTDSSCAFTYPVLSNIVRYDILNNGAIVVVQKYIKEFSKDIVNLKCFRIKKYGDTIVSFYKK